MQNDTHIQQGELTRRTLVGGAWLLLWRFVTRSLGFVGTLLLARLLLPSDFGLVAMATSFSYGIESLSQLGLLEALVRRRETGFGLHHTAFTLQLVRASLTGCAIAAGAPIAAWWFAEPRLTTVLLVLAGMTIINGFENVGVVEYRRDMRFDVQFKLMLYPRLAGFVAMIAYAVVWRDYWALLAGMLVSSGSRVVMTYWLHPFRPKLQLARWRELASFSLWAWAAAVASVVWDRCDPFVLGPTFGSAKLGIYLLALQVAFLPITELISPAAEALFVAFARAQIDGHSSSRHAPDIAGIILIGAVPIVLTVSAASGPIVDLLLGPKWTDARPIIAVLTWACVFSPFSYVYSTVLVANGHVKRNFLANLIASSVKLIALLIATAFAAEPAVIGTVTVACVAVESVVFLALLHGTGELRNRRAVGVLTRVGFATLVTATALNWSHLGWQSGAGSIVIDVIRVFFVCCMSAGIFAATEYLSWYFAGCPDGAEKRLIALVARQLAYFRPLKSAAASDG